jgi:hypothetical protein
MPRYLKASCCYNEDHVANRKLAGFENNLLRDLKDTAEHVRDFLFTSGHKAAKVLDLAVSWRHSDIANIWGADPVHPTEAAKRPARRRHPAHLHHHGERSQKKGPDQQQ